VILLSCRDSIEFGNKQLCISEELDSPNMRAEAYLNLARAHERLGALDRALDYARHRFEFTSHLSYNPRANDVTRVSKIDKRVGFASHVSIFLNGISC
jgi:hypothetical protein